MKKGGGTVSGSPAATRAGEGGPHPRRGAAKHGHAALSGVVVGVSGGLSQAHTASLEGARRQAASVASGVSWEGQR